jgi:hypothetical protein
MNTPWAKQIESAEEMLSWLEARKELIKGVMDGTHKIVPMEPTDEMVNAALASTSVHHNIAGSGLTVAREKMRIRYRAALAILP